LSLTHDHSPICDSLGACESHETDARLRGSIPCER
jgi:hypothetical protein